MLRRPGGSVDRVVNVIEDVSEVKRAERAQALLGDAMRVLSESADHEPALQRVAELVADRMADWCAIDLRTGRAARRAGLAPAGAPRPEPPGDELVVPLVAGGEPLGTLSLVRADEVRRFTPADRAVAEQLGERAAAAVLGGRLARERAEIARELQHGLLPPGLPEIPGLEVAALYRPAGELNEVGGDFYDAFPTPRGLDGGDRRRRRPGRPRRRADRAWRASRCARSDSSPATRCMPPSSSTARCATSRS